MAYARLSAENTECGARTDLVDVRLPLVGKVRWRQVMLLAQALALFHDRVVLDDAVEAAERAERLDDGAAHHFRLRSPAVKHLPPALQRARKDKRATGE